MASVVRKWRKFLAVSCSHGHLANPSSLRAVLKFRDKYQPETVMHLGDFLDLAALRKEGHVAGADGAESIKDDFDAGVAFLRELRPTQIFLGNHEDRLTRLARSPNAIVSHCAGGVMGQLQDLARDLKAKIVPYDIDRGWLKFGDTMFGHGYMFNQTAIRDHAETFGKCVIGHLHKVGQEQGRRSDKPTGFCVGCLADIPRMTYAKTQRSRLAWENGFAWGEYCDDHCIIRLEKALPDGSWRLPL